MSWLFAGYAAFFVLLGGYFARLLLMERRLARERDNLAAARVEAGDRGDRYTEPDSRSSR